MGFYAFVFMVDDIPVDIFEEFVSELLNDMVRRFEVAPLAAYWAPDYFELFVCPLCGSATELHRQWLGDRLNSDLLVDDSLTTRYVDAWHDRIYASKRKPHPLGRWTGLVVPGDEFWKFGQPAGWLAHVRWAMQGVEFPDPADESAEIVPELWKNG